MTKILNALKSSKSGASAAEYALIIALVGIAIIGGATVLGTNINDRLSSTAGSIANP